MNDKHYKAGKRNIQVGIALGAFLIIMKATLGFWGRSHALIADAVHSITDLVSDAFAFFGVKFAFMGIDDNHPFGHGKIDTLMSLFIGISMVLAGLWLGFENIITLVYGETKHPNILALIGALASVIVKELLYRYTHRVGTKIGSKSLIANAKHHRTDAFSSLAVVFAIIPALLNPELAFLDSIAAIVVAIMIVKVGIDVSVPAFMAASDASPEPEDIARITTVAESVDGVLDAHDIKARFYSSKLYAEIHIVVDPEITVRQGHQIAENTRTTICQQIPEVIDIIVHVDPLGEED
jgi:cation diffusion facilitator family transporter